MEDNSIISNFANDKDFESSILKDLRQVIDVVADRYPNHEDFRFGCQKILKMNEEELNNIEILYETVQRSNKVELLYEIEQQMKGINLGIDEITNSVNQFCNENGYPQLIKRKLNFLLSIDPLMTHVILCEYSDLLICLSDAVGITNRYKSKYEKLTDIIPCEEEFLQYLMSKPHVYLDAESMKVYLSEYMETEVEKFYNLPKNLKYKQQSSIDITPHQTLSIETTTANVEEGKPNKKQPSAKVMMAFINLIDDRAKIIPKDSINNDVKFTILSNKIKELFKYEYAGKTLEKDQYKLEGYSLEVYNLLTEWEYNTEALKYKNRHNL